MSFLLPQTVMSYFKIKILINDINKMRSSAVTNIHSPIDDDYYDDGIEYFRENYDNCIFVVASDDIEWCKKHIDTSKNDIFFSDSKPTFHKDEYGRVIDNDFSKAAYDLVLLSSCNHTVISRGKE